MIRATRMLEQVRAYLARRGQEAEAAGDEDAVQSWGRAAGHVRAAAEELVRGNDGEQRQGAGGEVLAPGEWRFVRERAHREGEI